MDGWTKRHDRCGGVFNFTKRAGKRHGAQLSLPTYGQQNKPDNVRPSDIKFNENGGLDGILGATAPHAFARATVLHGTRPAYDMEQNCDQHKPKGTLNGPHPPCACIAYAKGRAVRAVPYGKMQRGRSAVLQRAHSCRRPTLARGAATR